MQLSGYKTPEGTEPQKLLLAGGVHNELGFSQHCLGPKGGEHSSPRIEEEPDLL